MIGFKMQRSYVEALYLSIMPQLRLHCQSIRITIASQPLSKEKLLLMIEISLLQSLDRYFERRLALVKSPAVNISLPEPEAICLYQALMAIRLNEHDTYLIIVRQGFIEKLFPVLCGTGPAPKANLPQS